MTFPTLIIQFIWNIFLISKWSGCEDSPKNSLISDDRKLFWKRQCSEEEDPQSKSDWIRSEFLLFFPKSRLPSLVLDCYICDAVETTSTNRSGASDGGAVLCTWHETWGQPVQETTTTATSRPWQEQRNNLNQAGGREEGRGVMSNFLKQTCAEEEKKTENDFGRTFLKLCWVMIGWLPPLPISCHRHRQQVHFIHL